MEITHGRRRFAITNPDRILFPKQKITKLDLIEYYQAVSSIQFPLIKNHPIVMQRFPEGINHEGFFHKDAPDYFPSWIKRIDVPRETGGLVHYVVANDPAVVPYLASQGCITPHVWLSQASKLTIPDRIIFDLDPGKAGFAVVRKTALIMHDFFQELGLQSFAMTTGSAGMHVVIPIKRQYDFDQVRTIARAIAQELVNQYPQMLTLEIRKEKRAKRLFIDFLRNAFGATGAAPYAVRPLDGAPVAAPIDWKEVADAKLISQRYTIKTILKRLDKKGDPWEDFFTAGNSLARLKRKLKASAAK